MKNGILKKILNYRELGLVITLILLLIGAGIFVPSFFGVQSISSMLTNNAVYAILTVGILFVLLTGEIDLSIGSILAVSGVSVTWLYHAFPAVPTVIWLPVGVLIGALCGAVNGFFAGRVKIPSMIVTLGTMYAFRGLAYVITGGNWATPDSFTPSFTALAQFRLGDFKIIVLWAVLLFILAALFLGLTRPGRRLYAIGSSAESSVVAGINIAGAKLLAFVLCGACAGLAGVLYAANYAAVNSEIGSGYEMTAIATCILGGVSIVGGRGRIDGIVISTLLMSMITYILSLFPGFNIWQNALQGAIILVAVGVNLFNGKLAEKRAVKGKEALI